MRSHKINTGLFVFLMCLVFSAGTQALITSVQFGKIINTAGRQRMLSQKMIKEAAEISQGLNASRNRLILRSDLKLFEDSLNSLISGNPDLDIPAAEGADLIAQLEKTREIWQQLRKPLESVLGGTVLDKGALKQADELGLSLLKESNNVVTLFVAQSRKASGSQTSDLATTINMAGKQRMLSQKMTKEFMLIAMGVDETINRARLLDTCKLFDKIRIGLKSGDQKMGLVKTNNPKILGFLGKVDRVWQLFQPRMETVSQGSQPTQEDLAIVGNYNLQILINCNETVKLYEKDLTERK